MLTLNGYRTARKWLGNLTVILLGMGTSLGSEIGDPQEGYRLLTEKAYLPPDFDQEVFDELWKRWPKKERQSAQAALLRDRRRLTMERYGLSPRPNDPQERPLQYVVSDDGTWSMNCFACHGGNLLGQTVPGLPNRDFALEQLTADVRATKIRLGKTLSHMDLGSLIMPLGSTRGTTNAVMFGVALLANRHDDLRLKSLRIPPKMVHHDMDAPPWWHFRLKQHLYIDGFAPKGHRALMQFILVEQNGPDAFRSWEDDFRHIYAFLSSLQPPKFPGTIDRELASAGRLVFDRHCATCHGYYRDDSPPEYPERVIPWDEVATDRVRLDALTPVHRQRYASSWFHADRDMEVLVDPNGYVAPPLTGVWATAPYLHNGSVPTLWHLLRPAGRPTVWRRTPSNYDLERIGLSFREPSVTESDNVQSENRFDTRQTGKHATGHDFPSILSENEKLAVLEYLKTL